MCRSLPSRPAVRYDELDGVTLDVHGTLVRLVDPMPALAAALRERGVERRREEIAAAFAAEGRFYDAHSHEGRDEASLADLGRRSAGVFLDALGAGLDPDEFAEPYVGALRFEPIDGARETLATLRAKGLRLAAVTNWDVSVHRWLAELGFRELLDVVVTAAETGARKPDGTPILAALAHIGADPRRAAHVGDAEIDRRAAEAAGVRFLRTPLRDAFAGWT